MDIKGDLSGLAQPSPGHPKINGTQRGTYSSTGYIRTNQGHQESSLHINEVFQLNANDVVSVGIIRTANSGTVNLRSASSSNIYIERI
jgi:hypothetical protein